MQYAIDIAPLGPLSDPATIVRLAVAAEAAGWDGLSTWDSLGASMGTAAADPFRTQWVRVRTLQANQIRGLLYEFGVVVPLGWRALLSAATDSLTATDRTGADAAA